MSRPAWDRNRDAHGQVAPDRRLCLCMV